MPNPNPYTNQLRRMIDSNDPFMTMGHREFTISSTGGRHDIPEWTLNDGEVRKVVERAFPKSKTDGRQRRGAARWLRVIYLYYRMNMCRKKVLETMQEHGAWPELTLGKISHVLEDIRNVAAGLTVNGKDRHPDTKRGGKRPRAGRPKSIKGLSALTMGSEK